jgi:hypothetical protein
LTRVYGAGGPFATHVLGPYDNTGWISLGGVAETYEIYKTISYELLLK